jgi:hypothetical protein
MSMKFKREVLKAIGGNNDVHAGVRMMVGTLFINPDQPTNMNVIIRVKAVEGQGTRTIAHSCARRQFCVGNAYVYNMVFMNRWRDMALGFSVPSSEYLDMGRRARLTKGRRWQGFGSRPLLSLPYTNAGAVFARVLVLEEAPRRRLFDRRRNHGDDLVDLLEQLLRAPLPRLLAPSALGPPSGSSL